MTEPDKKQEPAAPPHTAFFLDGAKRQKVIQLEFPVSFDGREWHHVNLRRMTLGEVGQFIERIAADAKDPGAAKATRFPILVDDDGVPIPVDLLDCLDDDDVQTIDEAAASFLPRRFRDAQAIESTPPTIGSSEDSSAAPSAGVSKA